MANVKHKIKQRYLIVYPHLPKCTFSVEQKTKANTPLHCNEWLLIVCSFLDKSIGLPNPRAAHHTEFQDKKVWLAPQGAVEAAGSETGLWPVRAKPPHGSSQLLQQNFSFLITWNRTTMQCGAHCTALFVWFIIKSGIQHPLSHTHTHTHAHTPLYLAMASTVNAQMF